MTEGRFTNLQQFNPDQTNRINPLDRDATKPSYTTFGQDIIRGALKEATKNGWPEYPKDKIHTTSELFDEAFKVVDNVWNEQQIDKLLHTQTEKWLAAIPDNNENKRAIDVLSNTQELGRELKIQQFGELEVLRTIVPEAWRTLLAVSSERQLATLTLLNHWVKEYTEEEFDNLRMSKTEVTLFLKIGGIFGKYFDQAFIKQTELADAPTGSNPTKLSSVGVPGVENLYDLYTDENDDGIEIKTYSKVFEFEWQKIVTHLQRLAAEVESKIQDGNLPEKKYASLPEYLKKMSAAYGSDEKDPEKLLAIWQSTYDFSAKVIAEGCPIVIIPQACATVAGAANKIDVEMRLGLITGKETNLMENSKSLQLTAEEKKKSLMADSQDGVLSKDYSIPPVVVTTQPFAFGPNLYWNTEGESGENRILIHTDANTDIALEYYLPMINQVFKLEKVNHDGFVAAATKEAITHELGHMIMTCDDKNVKARIGYGTYSEAEILEELKAETLGASILYAERSKTPGHNFETEFQAILGTIMHYVFNKSSSSSTSGERYYYTGAYILKKLLEQGVLTTDNGNYRVTDHKKGMKTISAIGDDVVKEFYSNTSSNSDRVVDFIETIKNDTDTDEKFNRFLVAAKQ